MRQKIIAIIAMLLAANTEMAEDTTNQTEIITPAAVVQTEQIIYAKEMYSNEPLTYENMQLYNGEEDDTIMPTNLKASTISVSCIKVTWDALQGVEYDIQVTTSAKYKKNISVVRSDGGLCYLTGLREGSSYDVTVTPKINGTEYKEYSQTVTGQTESVNIIQVYQYEEGWTNCYAGERASGLTLMPSSGAIAGSVVDPITGTGIRRNSYGDYCCAMGLWYGQVGSRFLVETMSGQQFTVQICDSKGFADDADGDGIPDGRFHWFGGTGVGKCIVEFIYDDGNLPATVAYSGSWGYQNWNGLDLTSPIANIKMIAYGNPIEGY